MKVFGASRWVAPVTALAAALLTTEAKAAPEYAWNIPSNVRVVQQAPVDNVRTFASVAGAIASIPTSGGEAPSASNPYLIKVMPGRYLEAVVLPSYVKLQGSGVDTTILSAPASSSAPYTVSCATSSSLEDLTVEYDGAAGVGVVEVQDGARAVLDRVKIVMPPAQFTNAIDASHSAALELRNSQVLLASDSPYSADVALELWQAADVRISKSRFDITTARTNVFVVLMMSDTTMEITESIFNLVATSSGAIELVDGSNSTNGPSARLHRSTVTIANVGTGAFSGLTYNMEIRSSSVVASGNVSPAVRLMGSSVIENSTISGSGTAVSVDSLANIRINNSTISGATLGIEKPSGSSFRIGGSQLVGGHQGVAGQDRVTNCYDGEYVPVPSL